MAISFLTGFSPVGTLRRSDATPAQADQPAAPARNERTTDRRSAPAVQVRLSPQALAVLNGAPPPQAAPASQAAQAAAQATKTAAPASAAAFEPLAFPTADRPAVEQPSVPRPQQAGDAPQRLQRPGSRLDIKL